MTFICIKRFIVISCGSYWRWIWDRFSQTCVQHEIVPYRIFKAFNDDDPLFYVVRSFSNYLIYDSTKYFINDWFELNSSDWLIDIFYVIISFIDSEDGSLWKSIIDQYDYFFEWFHSSFHLYTTEYYDSSQNIEGMTYEMNIDNSWYMYSNICILIATASVVILLRYSHIKKWKEKLTDEILSYWSTFT